MSVEYPGYTRGPDVPLVVGATVEADPSVKCAVTGDQLYEIVIVGPTGDYSWGFNRNEEIAKAEATRLNDFLQVVIGFFPDAYIGRTEKPNAMAVYALRS